MTGLMEGQIWRKRGPYGWLKIIQILDTEYSGHDGGKHGAQSVFTYWLQEWRERVTMNSTTFFLDFPLPTLNEMIRTARGNKFAAAAQKKKYTNLVADEIMVQTERPHFEAISLDITWIETKKKRDPDNIFSAAKFLMDGIVAAGIIDDDDRDHVASITNRIAVSNSRGVLVRIISVPKPLYTIADT